MTTPPLLRFYETVLNATGDIGAQLQDSSMVVADPASMGSKKAIRVDQKSNPGQLGKLQFRTNQTIWDVRTSNISRFHFDGGLLNAMPDHLCIDGTEVSLPAEGKLAEWGFSRSSDGWWVVGFGWQPSQSCD